MNFEREIFEKLKFSYFLGTKSAFLAMFFHDLNLFAPLCAAPHPPRGIQNWQRNPLRYVGCVLKAAEKLQFWRGFEPAISKRCKKNHYKWQKKLLECLGFDLGTPGMQNQSSTTALQGQHIDNAHFLQPYWANLSISFLAWKKVPSFKKF